MRQEKEITMMRKLLSSVALASAVTFVGFTAAPAPRAEAAGCVYYVKVFAFVRENPSPN